MKARVWFATSLNAILCKCDSRSALEVWWCPRRRLGIFLLKLRCLNFKSFSKSLTRRVYEHEFSKMINDAFWGFQLHFSQESDAMERFHLRIWIQRVKDKKPLFFSRSQIVVPPFIRWLKTCLEQTWIQNMRLNYAIELRNASNYMHIQANGEFGRGAIEVIPSFFDVQSRMFTRGSLASYRQQPRDNNANYRRGRRGTRYLKTL